eukprot:367667_1
MMFSLICLQILFLFICNGNDNGLIAYYPFDGNAADMIGNRDGIIWGATLTEDMHDNANSAYSFSGNDYIEISATGLPSGARTISLWFYARSMFGTPTTSSGITLFAYGGGGSCGSSFMMVMNNADSGRNKYEVQGHCRVDRLQYEYSSAPLNVWTNWVVTTNQYGTNFYINGANNVSNSLFMNTATTGTNLAIGTNVAANGIAPYADPNVGYFNGIIDEIRIYDRALLSHEISSLYQKFTAPISCEQSGEIKHINWNELNNANDNSGEIPYSNFNIALNE